MIILAIPVDLQIALEVVLSAVLIGIVLGATASYAGGIADEIILRVTDIFLAVPGILLAIVFMVVFGRTFTVLTTAVVLIWWPTYVRLVRSQVLSEKERPVRGEPEIDRRGAVPDTLLAHRPELHLPPTGAGDLGHRERDP